MPLKMLLQNCGGDYFFVPASVFHSIACCVAIRSSFGNSIQQRREKVYSYSKVIDGQRMFRSSRLQIRKRQPDELFDLK
jgi:hypothetical protein